MSRKKDGEAHDAKEPGKNSEKGIGRKFLLRLYVTGQTPRSIRSIDNLKQFCEKHLHGKYEIEVIDIYQQPALAKENQIIAAPTLIKQLPLPLRRLVGDFSNRDRILSGLDLTRA